MIIVGVPSLIVGVTKIKVVKKEGREREREQERKIKTRKKRRKRSKLIRRIKRVMRFRRREFFFGKSSSNISLNRDIIFVYITQ